jgi:hypothetical protein
MTLRSMWITNERRHYLERGIFYKLTHGDRQYSKLPLASFENLKKEILWNKRLVFQYSFGMKQGAK